MAGPVLALVLVATLAFGVPSHAGTVSEGCTTNGRIAFVTDDPATAVSDISVVSRRGMGLTTLTVTGDSWSPSWSPDGTRLVFEDHVDGDGDIYAMDRDGTNVVNLTEGSTADEATPEWSPNGRWIAFASDRANPRRSSFDIYKMRADGSGVTRLTSNRVQDWTPTWAPNGRRIAFVRIANIDQLMVMRADGSRVRNITGDDDGTSPDWSPNGRRIAYQSLDGFGGEMDIYTIGPDGTRMKRLTTSGANEQSPSWSPDGHRIAFTRSWQLYKMRPNGSKVIHIPTGDGDVYVPSWGPRPC